MIKMWTYYKKKRINKKWEVEPRLLQRKEGKQRTNEEKRGNEKF